MNCSKNPQVCTVIQYDILDNFDNISESKCVSIDKNNNKLYQKLMNKAKVAEKAIKDSGLFMNLEVPPPPKPCNKDRYILWKKRNIMKPVILQSEAVLYLYKNNYILNEQYEAYQAIDLATEISTKNGMHYINNIKKSNNYETVYNNKDTNILRRRSMYGKDKLDLNRNYDTNVTKSIEETNMIEKTNRIEETNMIEETKRIEETNRIEQTKLGINNFIKEQNNIKEQKFINGNTNINKHNYIETNNILDSKYGIDDRDFNGTVSNRNFVINGNVIRHRNTSFNEIPSRIGYKHDTIFENQSNSLYPNFVFDENNSVSF